jgi:hypothetical protein
LKFCCKNQPNNGTAKSLSAEKLERRIRPEFRKICDKKMVFFDKYLNFFLLCLKHQQNHKKAADVLSKSASQKLFITLFDLISILTQG